MAQGLDWHITGLWYPGQTTVPYYGRIADPSKGKVEIPLCDSRLANVTLSIYDPLVRALRGHTYVRLLKAYYYDELVFWGVIKGLRTAFKDETVTLTAHDRSYSLIHHMLRRGDLGGVTDGALTAGNDDKGWVTVDRVGLGLLRDAGLNTTDQTTRGVPDLGIIDGTNTYPDNPNSQLGVTRGDEVWNTMVQLSQSLGPDFELEPVDDTVGAYAKLNVYDGQGIDRSDTVAWHYGTGKQNLEDLVEDEGSKYTTHVHVLSRDGRYRFTEADIDSSAETGIYVDWDATDFDSTNVDAAKTEAALRGYGQEVIKAYGRPLTAYTLTLPVETPDSYRYKRDYGIGDVVEIAGRLGEAELDQQLAYRITGVTLEQEDSDNGVRPSIDVVANRVVSLGDTLTGSEE